jgi:hypothetical protein
MAVMQDGFESVQITGIPIELRTRIQDAILNFAVPVFVGKDPFQSGREAQLGSGTLVAVAGMPYLLTAAHVWDAIREHGLLAILLDAGGHAFSTPTDALTAFVSAPRETDEWGPDLAFVKLPQEVRALSKDRKAFYQMDRRLENALTTNADTSKGLWAVAGAPAVWTQHGAAYSVLSFNTLISGIDHVREINADDYFDLAFNHANRPDLPSSYEGVSGAGLWHARVGRSRSTGEIVWDDRVHLDGVAFYQEFNDDGRGVIRCHGRRSLFGCVRRLTAQLTTECRPSSSGKAHEGTDA